jgi:DnaJ family protein A protein 2
LILEKEISLAEALTGFQFYITHLDGRELLVCSENNVTKPNEIKIIENEGMPSNGHLYIKFNVKFPETLTSAQLNAIKSAFEVAREEPRKGAVPVVAKEVDSDTGYSKNHGEKNGRNFDMLMLII